MHLTANCSICKEAWQWNASAHDEQVTLRGGVVAFPSWTLHQSPSMGNFSVTTRWHQQEHQGCIQMLLCAACLCGTLSWAMTRYPEPWHATLSHDTLPWAMTHYPEPWHTTLSHDTLLTLRNILTLTALPWTEASRLPKHGLLCC